MDNGDKSFLMLILVIAFIFIFGVFVGDRYNRGRGEIISNQRIKPQLKITIENGKSDTLFIYKQD